MSGEKVKRVGPRNSVFNRICIYGGLVLFLVGLVFVTYALSARSVVLPLSRDLTTLGL
jgi:hypothetical protein